LPLSAAAWRLIVLHQVAPCMDRRLSMAFQVQVKVMGVAPHSSGQSSEQRLARRPLKR